jgi:tRNA threonylcarbamoyladenosine modification (KEOPS) complex  Pcc1 subunit
LKVRVKMAFTLRDPAAAEVIVAALKPDNIDLPPGISLSTEAQEGRVVVLVEGEDNIPKLLGTLNDLLTSLEAGIDALEVSAQGGGR